MRDFLKDSSVEPIKTTLIQIDKWFVRHHSLRELPDSQYKIHLQDKQRRVIKPSMHRGVLFTQVMRPHMVVTPGATGADHDAKTLKKPGIV